MQQLACLVSMNICVQVQSKLVNSNYFFLAENGKNKPIVGKNDENKPNNFFTDQGNKIS